MSGLFSFDSNTLAKINSIQSNLGNLFTNHQSQPQSNQNDKLFNTLNSYQNQNYPNGYQQYPYQQQIPYNQYHNQYTQQNYGNNYFNSNSNPPQEKIKLNYSTTNYTVKQELPIENKKNGKKDPFADLLK